MQVFKDKDLTPVFPHNFTEAVPLDGRSCEEQRNLPVSCPCLWATAKSCDKALAG